MILSILYADKNLKAIEQTVNAELINVHDWLATNTLTLNAKESNFVIFRPRQKKMHFSPEISILDCETSKRVSLEKKSYIKYLIGVLINQNLSRKNHVYSVIITISKTIAMIAKLRYFVPCTLLINIYNYLILPYITYRLIAWGNASNAYLNKVLVLQKWVLCFIYFTGRREHAIPLFTKAKILPVTFLYYETVSKIMLDLHNQNQSAPINIVKLFTKTSHIHTYNTWSSKLLHFGLNLQKTGFLTCWC